MSNVPQGFVFDRYVLRAALPTDVGLAAAWMEMDPFHRGNFAVEFWIEQVSGRVVSFVLQEVNEGPVFFFRLEMLQKKTVEIYIQFAPAIESAPGAQYARSQHMRTMRALKVGWEWLKKRLTGLGYGVVSFRSVNPALVMFFYRQGFEHSGDTLWYVLQPRMTGAVEGGNDVRTDGAAD